MFEETQEREGEKPVFCRTKKTPNDTGPPTTSMSDKDFQFKMKMVKCLQQRTISFSRIRTASIGTE